MPVKGKRRRYVESSDDDTYEPSRKPTARKKKREPQASSEISSVSGLRSSSSSHSKSLHVIASVNPLRACLLDWYSQVHERRGMPWRKSYDPSLDADGRAQRAYEVNFFVAGFSKKPPKLHFYLGMDIRDYASTDPSGHSDTIL
jgi:A/G-specific adenine glycosylase